ncbi:MAG: lysostaphin resistance A-like protein [Verrucomicrobiales bacterium]
MPPESLALEHGILVDVVSIAIIALGVGLLVHLGLRRRNPERGYGTRGNVGAQTFGVLDLPVLAVLLVVFYFTVRNHGAVAGAEGAQEDSMGLAEAWFGVVFYLFLLLSLLFFLGFVRLKNLSEVFGLSRLRPSRILIYGVAAMAAAYPLVLLATWVSHAWIIRDAFGEMEPQEIVRVMAKNKDFSLAAVLVLSTCVVAPVVEEVLFRGYIYPVVKRFSDQAFAGLFTSLLFAVVHLNVPSLVPLWVLALCFTVAYEFTGCLWVPIVMHAIFNLVNVILLLAFPELVAG